MKKHHLLLLLTLFTSCHKEKSTTQINIVDSYATKIYYELEILNDDDEKIYQVDEKGKCSVVLRNEVFIDSVYFGSFDEVHKAVQKVNEETESSKSSKIVQRTSIGIKNKRNSYEEIWSFDNELNLNSNIPNCKNCYGLYETKIELEDGITKYKNKRVHCLKVIFKEVDDGEGAATRTFFYARNLGAWKLIKRAKLNTEDKTYTEEEYDEAYTNTDCDFGPSKNKIEMTIDCLLD
ncbi:hypothetical protein ACFSX9_09745 [Flavobacterium ardleyense]|uniref:Lipoprotein n=1 Tax=Flavobacterium ardleyense TaxID=2038737 RepID=A0ABW5Z9R6_9FLAO